MKLYRSASGICLTVLVAALAACGGGGSGDTGTAAGTPGTPTATTLTVTGTAATGLAIAGATVTGKCKVGTGTATTLANGTFTLTVTDGQLPCVLQVTNPADGTKLHTLVVGTGNTAVANITPLTEMTTARVLGSEPNVFFAAFDAAAATQKVTTANIATARTAIDLVFTGTIDTTGIGDFMTTPLVAATQGSPASGDAQDKLLDALKLKLTRAQIGTIATAMASNQTMDAIKQTVVSMTTAPTTPPVANAGTAQSVVTGTTVTLDASTSSAAAGKSLTYAWTLTSKPTGSAATLAAPATAKPTFVADVAGSYVASVIVNDGTTASSAAAVTVTASVANAAPVANAGVAQNVVAGSAVTLDGSASSDANSDPLTYAWTLTSKPAGSTAVLSSTTSAKPTFTANLAGTYVASLTVNDGKVNSTTVTVSITAAVANVAPVANAGVAQNVVAGSVVTLAGSASSDANSDPLTYAWTLTSKPTGSVATLASSTSVKPTFRADMTGTYVASLTVNDGKVNSMVVTVSITASYVGKYIGNQNGTATDPTTGLTWMRCSMGQTWDGTTCTGTASTYTISQANALPGTASFAGQSDWRLPNIRELQTIVDWTAYYPTIDTVTFPATPTVGFWSGSSNAAWTGTLSVSFSQGYSDNYAHIGDLFAVRLVRGGQPSSLLDIARPNADYVDRGDGSVTHTPTGLIWQRCAVGQNWTGSNCGGAASIFTWDAAKLLNSNFAGQTDWRLPTQEELLSLVDFSKVDPSINVTLFPNTPSSVFWSSSPFSPNLSNAWSVNFGYGNTRGNGFPDYGFISSNGAVRLVRAGR